jgi:hypothetical protein
MYGTGVDHLNGPFCYCVGPSDLLSKLIEWLFLGWFVVFWSVDS